MQLGSKLLVRASYGLQAGEVEFEREHGVEILHAQVGSLFDGGESGVPLLLLDPLGRILAEEEDVSDAISADQRTMDVFCVDSHGAAAAGDCSRELEEKPLLQPMYKVVDTGIRLCEHCASSCSDPSLLVCEPHVLTTFSCDSALAAEIGLVPPPRARPGTGADTDAVLQGTPPADDTAAADAWNHPTSLHARRQLLEAAVLLQDSGAAPVHISCDAPPLSQHQEEQQHHAKRQFMQRLQGARATALAHEDAAQQQAAIAAVDFEKVHSEALLWREQSRAQGQEPADDAVFLAGLLAWFKRHFFKWCNKPLCQFADCPAAAASPGTGKCQDDMSYDEAGNAQPTAEEQENGASRTEVYKCRRCHRCTRFPRYNKPSRLLQTRTGRCGEWANCFGLICRAVGLDSRYILDFTDHVWVEVWLASEGRYCHCDPCENALDAPLTYEHGWGKNLTYVLSVSRHGVVDATAKYTRKLSEVLERRCALGTGFSEAWLRTELAIADGQLRDGWRLRAVHIPHLRGASVFCMDASDPPGSGLLALAQGADAMRAWAAKAAALADAAREERSRSLKRELQALALRAGIGQWKLAEMLGRISGDERWKRARGEEGK